MLNFASRLKPINIEGKIACSSCSQKSDLRSSLFWIVLIVKLIVANEKHVSKDKFISVCMVDLAENLNFSAWNQSRIVKELGEIKLKCS